MTSRAPRQSAARSTYAELSSPEQMSVDCRAAERELDRVSRSAVSEPPSLAYEDFPRELRKRQVSVDDAASRLANALHLHLD